jgi:hypothetical protein
MDRQCTLQWVITAVDSHQGAKNMTEFIRWQEMESDTESEEDEDKGQLCGDCGSPGAFWLCCGCAETYYCNRACEKNSWKREDHKRECAELQAKQKAALLGKHGPDPALASGGGSGGGARQVVGEEGQQQHRHLSPQQRRRVRMPTQSTLA